jgi:5-formyltetrahydrofolate cyclo-ligase
MTAPTTSDECRKLLWARVYQDLIRLAVPDSRYNFDFLSFTPDFRGSDDAVNRVLDLQCYKDAQTILVTCDNSLERLRYQALKDGKKVLVGTYRLRRGFVLLDPARIGDADFMLAACLDGMEKPGIGRAMSVAQLRDEGLRINMCAIGGLIFNHNGVVIHEGQALFEVQWALLQDIKVLGENAHVIAIAHTCQVIDEASLSMEPFVPSKSGEVQCDYVVTPDTIYEVLGAVKPTSGIDFKTVDPEALNNIPPLQELKGIRTMEQIMASGGFGQEKAAVGEEPKAPTAEEQMGIDIVAKLMKGYKA